MILAQAISRTDGSASLLLGLSEENVRRMADGQPITIPPERSGLDVTLVVFGGVGTEEELAADLRAAAGLPDDPPGREP